MIDLPGPRDATFLNEAYAEAAKSVDPSTQNGAVLVIDNEIVGRAYNRFARGVTCTPERLANRDEKYPRTMHAEEGAIWDAVRNGANAADLAAATLFVAWYACDRCAVTIIESGVRRVIGHREHPGVLNQHSKWAGLVRIGLEMLTEAGVECLYYSDTDKQLQLPPLRLDYKIWSVPGE